MSHRNNFVTVLSFLLFQGAIAHAAVLYVDDDAPPGSDGNSWKSAYTHLHDALAAAAASGDENVEVRVAQGLYIPDRSDATPQGTGNRYTSFVIPDGVTLRGGYRGLATGTGESPDDRDPEQFQTFLSGDLLQNDTAPFENTDDNSLHVVRMSGTQFVDVVVAIDGFCIERGNANVVGDKQGGGIFAEYAVLTVSDCIIRWNNGTSRGGGVRVAAVDSTFTNCLFEENICKLGGGFDQNIGIARLNNCTFNNNESWLGGAMCSVGGRFYLDDCRFISNEAYNEGGAIITETSVYEIRNSSFIANICDDEGGAIRSPQSDGWIENCLFEANHAVDEGGALDIGSNGTTILNCQFLGNSAGWAGAVATVANIDFVNCLFADNTAVENAGVLLSDGAATLTNCTIVNNTAGLDGGIVYTWCCVPTYVTNCIMVGNQAGPGFDLFRAPIDVAHSLVQEPIAGDGNIIADPRFVDSVNGDYRLMPGSICIDRGYNPILTEIVKTDLVGNQRFVDDPETTDSGVEDFSRPMIDFGAYEFCRGDADRNGIVNVFDLLLVLSSWNQSVRLADTDGDGDVDASDLITVLGHWGNCE